MAGCSSTARPTKSRTMPKSRPSIWAAAGMGAAMAPNVFGGSASASGVGPILQVENLDVHFGRAHVLQGVSFSLERGVLAVVGRNGMGKSTLCNAITGLVPASGAVRFAGQDILSLPPNRITNLGIGYVPQGPPPSPPLPSHHHPPL